VVRRVLLGVLTSALLVAPSASPALAAPTVRAVASWSMVPQAKDVNKDGIIDGDGGVPASRALAAEPAQRMVGAGNRVAQPNERLIGGALSWYLTPRGFPVRLDACQARGDRFRWRIAPTGGPPRTLPWRSLTARTCASTATLPEGPYDVTLEVRGAGRTDRMSMPVEVRNLLVVALGDSYASGEGNPRNVGAWLRGVGAFTPYWDEDPCHRSARGAPALAALALENASPRTSVTLVDVACSGATVGSGILGPQTGSGRSTSQVEQAVALMGQQAADAVLLSIGGNDVGFTSILQTCAFTSDCPVARPGAGPLAGYPTVQAGVQAQTAALAGDMDRIAACLGGPSCRLADGRSVPSLPLAPGAHVFPSLYLDITRAADGQPCTYLTISEKDFAWAGTTILNPAPPADYPYALSGGGTVDLSVASGSLNQQLGAAGRLPGWVPVTGTWSASAEAARGHGVCAGDQAWVFGFTGFGAMPSASFHPNPTGQAVMAQAIAATVAPLVVP
jgi:lysophospholipase L1-like esterase